MSRPPGMRSVRVRMYRHGLGDCFLVTFTSAGSPVHVLIDCGVLKGTENSQAQMTLVAENIRETTNGRVDLLVVTHEHWDHVSGFLQAESVFANVSVGEVWLAWTENPSDELANELRKRKAKAAKAVAAAAERLEVSGQESLRMTGKGLAALLDFGGDLGADARATTAGALDWAKAKPQVPPRYLNPGDLTEVPDVDDVRVYVLGPPHDRRLIKRSDPSTKHSEVYELAGDLSSDLGFLAATDALDDARSVPDKQPFDESFRLSDSEGARDPFFKERYSAPGDDWRTIEDDWLGVAGRVALQLDSDTNNTSLVLAFELPDRSVLLFPGDAQVGNWLSWEPLEWTVRESGAKRVVTSRELLARTVLYKVGHHGSHNATLREKGLELMTSPDLTALLPVNREMAKTKEWNMPFPKLYGALRQKTRGRILDVDLGAATRKPATLTDDEWRRFRKRTIVKPFWIDYTIEF